jgi:hypothetical protein
MRSLAARRRVTVTLPEFVVRALEYRVTEANQIQIPGDDVCFNDIVEWYLAGAISVRDVAVLDQQMPGFASAVNQWLTATDFEF